MHSPRGARPILTLLLGALCSLSMPACDSAPDDLREWRPEDHPAPPAVASDDRAAPPSAEAPATDARLSAALWTARCARCHGEAGRGGGPGAPPAAAMPDFTDPAYHAARTDNALALAVLKGRGLMPAFEKELSARQIALLVRHVRAFAQGAE